ncbi:hypothetical protein TSOC_010386, partial [Tetrabaena socialis]
MARRTSYLQCLCLITVALSPLIAAGAGRRSGLHHASAIGAAEENAVAARLEDLPKRRALLMMRRRPPPVGLPHTPTEPPRPPKPTAPPPR